MNEVSVTITAGEGCEEHNHGLEYRSKLEHTHDTSKDTVIELVPYEKSYKEQINELMKPYIKERNDYTLKRKAAAWDRYNSGQIKTKPRNRDYPLIGNDYYTQHLHDQMRNPKTNKMEQIKMFRSLIIGLGDKSDRENGKITKEQALHIFNEFLVKFKEDFPYFHILGATVHLDESGFYHMHLDFKPIYERAEDMEYIQKHGGGLRCGMGLDETLARMGYNPEQSIINERDKVPILFNAMRNKMYKIMETIMNENGLYLMYGATSIKEPEKDASINMPLSQWQDTKDKTLEMQHNMNIAKDFLKQDTVDEKNIVYAYERLENVSSQLVEMENSPKSRLNKNKIVVEYHVFDQLKTFIHELKSMIGALLKRIKLMSDKIDSLKDENKTLNNKLDSTKNELVQYKNDNRLLKIRLDDVKEQNSVLQTKVNDHNHSMLTMSKKLNKSEARNIALTRFVKETTRNQIHLKNGQSITVYDAIMNKLSPEDKTRVRKTMDLEGNKNSRNR